MTMKNHIALMPGGGVGIGVTDPDHLLELSGGAYSNGSTWENAASRDDMENIHELTLEDAPQNPE